MTAIVQKAAEFRKHAEDCRALARKAKREEERRQLLAMAETWERLANSDR
jgi:hypothetical protein